MEHTGLTSSSPPRNRFIQRQHAIITIRTPTRLHWQDLRSNNDHLRVLRSHLLHQRRERCQDGISREMRPHVVRPQHHGHDIGLRDLEPAWELVVFYDARCTEASMAVVLTVVAEAA